MANSIHLETSSSTAGRKTSTATDATEIGYKVLKIIEEFAKRFEFDISSIGPNLDGITKKYVKANPKENVNTAKPIIEAEIKAFLNLELVTRDDNVHSVFGSPTKNKIELTDKGRDYIATHEALQKAKEQEVEPPPVDPSLVNDIHISLLEATKALTSKNRKDGSTKVYIVTNGTKGNNSLRDEANAAFTQLKENGCFEEKKQSASVHARFKLSAIGKDILKNKPRNFPKPQETGTSPTAKQHYG